MKRILKHALVACVAAVFATAFAAPSRAQEDNTDTPIATYQGTPQQGYAADYGARAESPRDNARAVPGVEAYDYAPAQPGFGGDSCATQGTYGKGADYANCY